MGLNNTPLSERIHIGIFGRRNAGKSSVINVMTGQNLAIVSDVAGTTTDPVQKAMELLPLGPVVMIDTPGLDDVGELGKMRVEKAYQVLQKTDIAVIVIDASVGETAEDAAILAEIQKRSIPYIIVKNKADLTQKQDGENEIFVSAKTGENISVLKERIAALAPKGEKERRIIGDLLEPNDFVMLVVPIDSAAPKGRLILPQQQTIREILECGSSAVVTREHELAETLKSLSKKPRLVITDSQAFEKVSQITPEDIMLTSFSILFARYKGNLTAAVHGAAQLDRLNDGDTVLISEGCTHHRQCEDIGTVKMPAWIKNYTGKDIRFAFTSGTEFPEDLSEYALVIHCGGCMLNEREMQFRGRHAAQQEVPMTNYGIAIAQMHGILRRSLAPFPDVLKELEP